MSRCAPHGGHWCNNEHTILLYKLTVLSNNFVICRILASFVDNENQLDILLNPP